MSSNISNMKQAVFEMFGVGSGTEVSVIPAQVELAEELVPATQDVTPAAVDTAIPAPIAENVRCVATSYIAAGTVFEGTLRSNSDVDVAGEFKGDIEAEGKVTLYASMEGNVTAGSLTVSNSTLTGNAAVSDALVIDEAAQIHGDVSAREVRCEGQILGDLTVSGNAVLERTAQIHGNIVTGSFAVEKGAVIRGGIEIKGRDEK